jgi:hypothetical protein
LTHNLKSAPTPELSRCFTFVRSSTMRLDSLNERLNRVQHQRKCIRIDFPSAKNSYFLGRLARFELQIMNENSGSPNHGTPPHFCCTCAVVQSCARPEKSAQKFWLTPLSSSG